MSITRVIIAGLLLSALAGCGQKGPLFLPPPEAPTAAEPGPSRGAERDTAPAATLPAGGSASTADSTEAPITTD